MQRSEDDPTSQDFVPLDKRNLKDQARWWAVGRKRVERQVTAVLTRRGEPKPRPVMPQTWDGD